jgi:hypothetical protein
MMSRADSFSFRPVLWVAALGLAFIIMFCVHEDGKLITIGFFVLAFIITILFAFLSIYFTVQKKRSRALSYAVAIALLGVLYMSRERLLWLTDIARIYVFQSYYAQCAASASNYGTGALAVCDRYDTDWLVEAIIYDSGDEIALPSDHRSAEWKRTAIALERAAPFGIEGFRTTKIKGHFYRVYFLPEESPEL